MPLTLEVIGDKAARMGGAVRKIFTAGGTIGRLDDNDWIFPDEYISGHHAKILFENGAFLILDTSTNGVFVNSQQNRLPKGRPHPLRSGDTVFIDDYEVRVTLSQSPAAENYAPLRADPFGGSLIPDDPMYEGAVGSAGAPNATDPLMLLGLQSNTPVRSGSTAANLHNNSPLSQHYRPPTPVAPPSRPSAAPPTPPGVIPDDYDPMGGDEDPFAAGSVTPISRDVYEAPPASQASARPVPSKNDSRGSAPSAASRTIMTGPPRVPRPGARPPLEQRAAPPAAKPDRDGGRGTPRSGVDPFDAPVAADPGRNPGVNPAPVPVAPRRPNVPQRAGVGPAVPPRAGPSAQSSADSTAERRALSERRAPTGSVGELDFAAMLEAAGIDSVRVTPELSQQFGMILRVVVAGLMDVLRARDKIKDEFRMRMTSFKHADNNPLKFSANIEDALHNLLVKRNAAYLGPVEAFEDAFADVRNHQMAMLAGVRVAYEAMLKEFDPDRLQKDFDSRAKGANFLGGGVKAKYWELYSNRFHDMVKDADSSFRHLFGDDFAKAYEEQLSRLKASNRAGRK
jgi:type VI secretion system protein